MITIKVNDKKRSNDLIDPCDMIGSPHGTVFQQYLNEKAEECYYISCGHGEKSVVQLWFSIEEDEYCLSTDNAKSLAELYDTVKVREIDATIEINLITEE
mgnify:CR=1 FL=1